MSDSAQRHHIMIINGPNLGRLGIRQPEVYGNNDIETLKTKCQTWAEDYGTTVTVLQSDDEAQVIHWIYDAIDFHSDVVLNPAAFTHYSYALADAAHMVTDVGLYLVEVHISNPAAREAFRRHSVISPVATGTIAGFGFEGYQLAIEVISRKNK